MTYKFDRVVWNQPKWLHYAIGLVLALLAVWARGAADFNLGDRSPYLFVLLFVPAAAYVGGFGPGMFSTLVSIFAARYLYASPRYELSVDNPQASLQFVLTLSVCVTINLFAARLRNSAFRNGRLYEELASDRRQMGDVLSSMSDPFFVVDRKWTVLQTNPAFDQFIASPSGSIVGRSLWEVFPGREKTEVYRALKKTMETREPQLIESLRPGTDSWYEIRAFPTEFGVSVFIHDITERKMFETTRDRMLTDERVARSAAEEASRMKEDFLATLSHELRTPMTSLLGWANMLNRGNVNPERLAEGLNSIEQSARTQSKMVDELLDLSRINAGKLRVEMEILSLSELIEEAISVHQPAALAKGIDVEVKNDVPDALVRGDSGRLHQVFGNLISNAIKFTPGGGRVEIHAYLDGATVCFAVTDNGEGIAPEFLPHIFDRFRQANTGYSRKYGGLGLGLSIAKQLIELQGGTISARSEGKGKGSRFEVCLPVVPLSDRGFHRGLSSDDHRGLFGIRVLVVEDDEATSLMLQRLIEEHGGIVRTAPNAKEALASLDEFEPNVLLSDIGLPEMDGYNFMRVLRQRDKFATLPSIALTAFAREEDRSAAKAAGFNAFLTKPVNPFALTKALHELAKL